MLLKFSFAALHHIVTVSVMMPVIRHQCFDDVGWAAGRASSL